MRKTFAVPGEPSAYAFTHRLRVRFCETDAMGVVHHASYLAYLEEARVEYLRALGRPYDRLRAEGTEFPVVEAALRYRRPLRFDDEVDVHVMVGAASGATFQMSYLVGCGGRPSATAVTVHGVIDGQGRPSRVPAWLRDLVAS
ncbi:MAG TPA: thioesterase family protein [Acidimicrobiia bacterium]|nr:thioesterase family protein [Acidimicrobiia bacterium]